MNGVVHAVRNFFGVGPESLNVVEKWKKSAERKIKDGTYGLHMNQGIYAGKSSREKMVARADKLLSALSLSILMDKKEEEEDKESDEEDIGETSSPYTESASQEDTEIREGNEEQPMSVEDVELKIEEDIRKTKDHGMDIGDAVIDKQLMSSEDMLVKVMDGTGAKTDGEKTNLMKKEETAEPLSQPLTEDDLIYGKAALKHYKLFVTIENKRRISELKENLDKKMAEYEWKLQAVDELVNLARAYYNNPHSKQGEEWRRLKRLVQRKNQRKVSETVIRHELSKLPKFKPFFTYFIIIVQVITFAILCIFGGVTYIGLEPHLSVTDGIKTFLGTETVHRWTPPNVWIGPGPKFFIGIGALYPPCMREDYSIQFMYSQRNFTLNKPLGCCEVASRNTAGTTTEQECSHLTEGVGVWRDGVPCGERKSGENRIAHVLKPCCIDLKGTCELVSHAHCMFIGGVFHRTGPEHCTQVNCLAAMCNMGNLIGSPDQPWIPANPNQWWRLLLSLFYHHGILHITLVTVMQWLVMRQIEETAGWFRVALIYTISGIGGLLTSSLFEPGVVAMGGVSSVFGMIGVMTIELSQFWPSVQKPVKELMKIITVIVVFLILGTLPYLDSFGIIIGLLLGMLSAVLLLPYVTFCRWQVRIRLMLVGIALPCLFLVLFVLFYAFYKVQTFEACAVCMAINCVPYTENMCKYSLLS